MHPEHNYLRAEHYRLSGEEATPNSAMTVELVSTLQPPCMKIIRSMLGRTQRTDVQHVSVIIFPRIAWPSHARMSHRRQSREMCCLQAAGA
jgi:hypothetical protein